MHFLKSGKSKESAIIFISMLLKTLVLACAISFSLPSFSVWEYRGYGGESNRIDVEGDSQIAKSSYPPSWNGFESEPSTLCLCEKKYDPQLVAAVKKAFGNKWDLFRPHIPRGTLVRFPSNKKNGSAMIKVFELHFSDKSRIDDAFNHMKKELLKHQQYAVMKNKLGVIFAEHTSEVPARAFLHFVRGYDDASASRKIAEVKKIEKKPAKNSEKKK